MSIQSGFEVPPLFSSVNSPLAQINTSTNSIPVPIHNLVHTSPSLFGRVSLCLSGLPLYALAITIACFFLYKLRDQIMEYCVTHAYSTSAYLLLSQFHQSLSLCDSEGQSLFHLAAQNGDLQTLRVLSDCYTTQATPGLTEAQQQGLLQADNPVEFLYATALAERGGDSAVHLAAQNGHIGIITYLSSVGFDVRSLDSRGRSALHYAAEAGQLETVKYLVNIGFDITSVDREGRSALHWAAVGGSRELVDYLLDSMGLSLNQQDESAYTAFHCAVQHGQL